MALRFYNTLSRRLEDFAPLTPGKAGMYTCGPTVYNYAHIGNYRAYIFEDLLRRTLKYCGYEVTQVMNLTDVDDKTIRDSRAAGLSLDDFTRTYKDAFFEDLKTLRIEPAEQYPAATGHIGEMIALIQTLIDKGFGYIGDDGCVYFSISKFPGYGKLARIDLSGQRAGVRIATDEYEKEQAADFALWKGWDEDDGAVWWDSPWGRGRPGWHIECSAMSMKYLGIPFDIHTGGVDNMFPHHEDEIAQSEAAYGTSFVNYWLHCEHLMVNNEKMSKSLGNFFTLRDLIDRGFSGREIRWLLMGTHYRQKLNFTVAAETGGGSGEFSGLEMAGTALRRIDAFIERLREIPAGSPDGALAGKLIEGAESNFRAGLEDDLNIAEAIAAIFELVRAGNRAIDEGVIGCGDREKILDTLRHLDQVLGLLDVDQKEAEIPVEIIQIAAARKSARAAKDFAAADRLRDELLSMGWQIKDTPDGFSLTRA